MLVSIITATYNSINYIESTYASIKAQTFENWEWLITDDCSSDASFDKLKEIALNDHRVKVFRNEVNSGAAVARNVSISHAEGDFMAFIDSDDLWVPEKLKKQLVFMGSSIDFSFTAYELIGDNGYQLNRIVGENVTGPFSYRDQLLRKCVIGCSTVMLRCNAYSDLNMPLIRTRQDYALWLKLLKKGGRAHALNDVLTQYRIVPGSISSNKIKAAKQTWFVYRQVENLSIIKAYLCFLFYAWSALFKK